MTVMGRIAVNVETNTAYSYDDYKKTMNQLQL